MNKPLRILITGAGVIHCPDPWFNSEKGKRDLDSLGKLHKILRRQRRNKSPN